MSEQPTSQPAEEHLELEIELDSDPEVLRFIDGRARSREEVEAAHRRRLADGKKVPGLGVRVGFVSGDFAGWWCLRASRELLRYGFGQIGLTRIFAQTMAVNMGHEE